MILGFFALASMLEDAPVDVQIKHAPSAVRGFIARRANCNHWLGEEPYDKARAREIDRAIAAGRCDALDTDERQLRRRYARDPRIGRLLDQTANRL